MRTPRDWGNPDATPPAPRRARTGDVRAQSDERAVGETGPETGGGAGEGEPIPAPVIMVSGRLFPAEQRWRPFEERRDFDLDLEMLDELDARKRGA